jgi:hypothetical protein
MTNAEMHAIQVEDTPVFLQRALSPSFKLLTEALVEAADRDFHLAWQSSWPSSRAKGVLGVLLTFFTMVSRRKKKLSTPQSSAPSREVEAPAVLG